MTPSACLGLDHIKTPGMAKQGIHLTAAAGVDFLLDVGVDATIRYNLTLSFSTSIKLSR